MAADHRPEPSDEVAQTTDSRMRLLAAAEQLLETGRPFTEITLEELTARVGLTRTAFYRHFEDKTALLMELADRVVGVFEQAAGHWFQHPAGITRHDLARALDNVASAHIEHRFTMSAVVDAAAYDPRVRDTYDAVIQRRITDMRRSFDDQRERGMIPPAVDLDQVTPWIGWMIERGSFQLLNDGPDQLRAYMDGMCEVIWRTLYHTEP